MLIMLKLKRGGVLEEPNPQVGSRKSQTPQTSPVMSHEEGHEMISEYERVFKKAFFEMSEMVKTLFEERNTRLQRESSNPSKGNGGDDIKPLPFPPPPPPYSPSSSSISTPSHTHPNSPKGHVKTRLLKS